MPSWKLTFDLGNEQRLPIEVGRDGGTEQVPLRVIISLGDQDPAFKEKE